MQCFPMPYPPYPQGEGSRTSVHDRLGPRQSGQQLQDASVPDQSHQRLAQFHPLRQEYRAKDETQPMQVDSGKTTADNVAQIGDVNVVVKEASKGPTLFSKSIKFDAQKPIMANDHEASCSSSASKCQQPRWCPPGLSHSQKRRLQWLRHP